MVIDILTVGRENVQSLENDSCLINVCLSYGVVLICQELKKVLERVREGWSSLRHLKREGRRKKEQGLRHGESRKKGEGKERQGEKGDGTWGKMGAGRSKTQDWFLRKKEWKEGKKDVAGSDVDGMK